MMAAMRTHPLRLSRAVVAVFLTSLLVSTPARAQAPSPPPASAAPYDAPAPSAPPVISAPAPPMAPALVPPQYPQYPGYPGMNAGGGVYVELRANSPNVRIERLAGHLRVPVCYAPCRQVLPINEVYAIGGNGVRSTSNFTLPNDRPQVTLDVQAGSSAALAGGAILMAGGVAAVYVGYFVFVFGSLSAIDEPSNSTTPHHTNAAGLALVVGGAVVAGIGLVMALGARTTVRSSTGNEFSQSPRRRQRPAIALTPRGLEF